MKEVTSKEVNKVIPIPPCNEENFYKLWLTFLTPLHHLTPRNVEVGAELLRHREHLSKVILDEKMLMKLLMSSDIKADITKKCNITTQNYHVALSALKKAGFFKDGTINKKLIPKLDEGKREYNLLLSFQILPEENQENA